jgi:hypothetical protein
MAQRLLMNCNEGDGEREGGDTDPDPDPEPEPEPEPDDCNDLNNNCPAWKDAGYCSGQHQEYMDTNCKKSCGKCGTDPQPNCQDSDSNCNYWAKEGYCSDSTYREWMTENCKRSCNKCQEEKERDDKEEEEEEEEDDDLPPVNCFDKDPKKCKKRAKKGHCTNPKKAGYMKKNCKKSCKLC